MLALMLAYGTEWISYALLAASVAWTIYSIANPPKPKLAPMDDAMETVATRGAYIPLVIGRQRIGYVFGDVQDAGVGPLDTGGVPAQAFGKGEGNTPEPQSYQENAVHFLCIGPGSVLHAIYQNGAIVWSGPITPQSHPSGSSINVPQYGTFQVHWGFPDDPQLTVGPANARVSSRFAGVLKVVWAPKKLGQSRNWPRLEYEVECPVYSQIAYTPNAIRAINKDVYLTFGDTPYRGYFDWPDNVRAEFAIFGCREDTDEIIVRFEDVNPSPEGLNDVFAFDMAPGTIIKLYSDDLNGNMQSAAINGVRDGYSYRERSGGSGRPWNGALGNILGNSLLPNQWNYLVVVSARSDVQMEAFIGTHIIGFEAAILKVRHATATELQELKNRTAQPPHRILNYFLGVRDGSFNPRGIAALQICDRITGVNPIHAVDQILFAPHPYGAARDRSLFDADTIERAAIVADNEELRFGITASDGSSIKALLQPIQQDLGLMFPFDPRSGKYTFKLLRYDDPFLVPDVPKDMIVSPSSTVAVQGAKPADTVAFVFRDRRRSYRAEPLVVHDNGQVQRYQGVRSRDVEISTTNEIESAATIARRRQQEIFATLVTHSFRMNRSARLAMVGQTFKATQTEDPDLTFRVTGVKPSTETPVVEISAIVDSYMPPPESTPVTLSATYTPSRKAAPEPLAAFDAWEVPRQLAGGRLGVLLLAARASTRGTGAPGWGSRDGTAYTVFGEAVLAACGTLTTSLPAGNVGPCHDSATYQVLPEGVDFDSCEDLTLSQAAWRAGRQIMLVGGEIIFLQTAGGGEITGLLRGRLGTAQVAHAAGTRFWVVLAHRARLLQSDLFQVGATLHYKAQSLEGVDYSDIGNVEAKTLPLVGAAFTPATPSGLRQSDLQRFYVTGNPITLTWCYQSDEFAFTGLGAQGFGQICGTSSPRGYFVLEFLNGATLLGTLTSPSATRTISPAEQTALGLDALTTWTVRVLQVEGSFSSGRASLTLTRT